MKIKIDIVLMISVFANLFLTIALLICLKQLNQSYIVQVQARELGLIVSHIVDYDNVQNLKQIVDINGDKINLEKMGVIFTNDKVTNKWGDEFTLVRGINDSKLLVHIVGNSFSWQN